MADEIEEFLRRAAMRRAAQQQAAQQQQVAQQQTAAPQGYQQAPPVRQQQPPMRPAFQPKYVEPEPVEVEVIYDEPQLGAGVASHVSQAMDNREFNERARHLGERVGRADDDMQANLNQKFDHQVGQLKSTTAPTVREAAQPSFDQARRGDAGTAPAGAGDAANLAASISGADIAQLFATPRNIRNAIILSEILTRPEHRW